MYQFIECTIIMDPSEAYKTVTMQNKISKVYNFNEKFDTLVFSCVKIYRQLVSTEYQKKANYINEQELIQSKKNLIT